MRPIDRRALFGASAIAAGSFLLDPVTAEQEALLQLYDGFPAIEPARVYDTVRYAHVDLERVRSLVSASPALANAAVDWGFGDWETAIGAAAHMGRRDMAELLLVHGARPDLFTHAMLGQASVVRATIEARPGIQRETGPHGFSLLHHARAGGESAAAVVDYLEQLGDADPAPDAQPLPHGTGAFTGTYAWGKRPEDRLAVGDRDGTLTIGYGDGFPRSLVHLGDAEFHPAGVRAVRIRFEIERERATAVSIFDPERIVRGFRIEPRPAR